MSEENPYDLSDGEKGFVLINKQRDGRPWHGGMDTGRRQRPQALLCEGGASEIRKALGVKEGESTVVISAASFVDLVEKYAALQRERALINAMSLLSLLIALVVLAAQVYKVLGRGY